MKDRILKQRRLESFWIDGHTFDEVIKAINELKERHPDKLNLRFNHEYDYGDDKYLYVIYDEYESDKEYIERKEAEAQNEKRQRQQYEVLKKKYGDKS